MSCSGRSKALYTKRLGFKFSTPYFLDIQYIWNWRRQRTKKLTHLNILKTEILRWLEWLGAHLYSSHTSCGTGGGDDARKNLHLNTVERDFNMTGMVDGTSLL